MNVPTITMEPETARVKAIEYGDVRASDPELEVARRAYERLADGGTLIDLRAALRQGGVDDEGMPRLAIARADRRFVTYEGPTSFSEDARFDSSSIKAPYTTTTLAFDVAGIFPIPDRKRGMVSVSQPSLKHWRGRRVWSHSCHGVTTVPIVPPSVERHRTVLSRRFVLWEVEEWAEPSKFTPPTPPGDPYLLEHFEGDLYAIVGEWDLTPLERAIVQGRELE